MSKTNLKSVPIINRILTLSQLEKFVLPREFHKVNEFYDSEGNLIKFGVQKISIDKIEGHKLLTKISDEAYGSLTINKNGIHKSDFDSGSFRCYLIEVK